MDDAYDVPDSTDWLNTPLSTLSPLENALHCQICKEFFDTPMITSCSHTFCSKCIRTAISTDGCCPACRTPDQASKLRNNWQLQEVVAQFLEARPAVLKVAKDTQSVLARPGKRKRVVDDSSNAEEIGRTTRSKSRKLGSQTSMPEVVEDDEDETYEPEPEQQNDGRIDCLFGCGQRVKLEEMNAHLDRCEEEKQAREAAARKKPPAKSRPQDRLNELNYSMMREKELAKRMKDLGIPAGGGKQSLIKRYTVWVNIWNANCDSSAPRTKRELLKELEVWERTQGGSAPNMISTVMRKDFDRAGYSNKNGDSFSKLIADARLSRQKAVDKAAENAEPVESKAEQAEPSTDEAALPNGSASNSELYSSSVPAAPPTNAEPAPESDDMKGALPLTSSLASLESDAPSSCQLEASLQQQRELPVLMSAEQSTMGVGSD